MSDQIPDTQRTGGAPASNIDPEAFQARIERIAIAAEIFVGEYKCTRARAMEGRECGRENCIFCQLVRAVIEN